MSVVISQSFVLTQQDEEFPVTANHPIIGIHNLVTTTSLSADTSAAGYPVTNLANPATHSEAEWRANNTTEQYLTFATDYVDDIDYIAVAKHNFSSAEIPTSIEGFISGVWTEIVEERMLTSDGPVLYRFTPQSLSFVRIRLQTGNAAARAAVVYLGKLLTLPRRIYVGYTPLPFGRRTEIQNGRSESGNFLGRVQLGAWRESVIPLSLFPPAWHRAYGDDFIAETATRPFFFAARPETYPDEVGYCWLTEDPIPVPVGPSNLDAYDLKVSGIV